MYVKLVDGNLEYAKHYLKDGDVLVINPSGEKYLEAGFKPLITDDFPEVGENQRLSPVYEENETEIFQGWEVLEVETNNI